MLLKQAAQLLEHGRFGLYQPQQQRGQLHGLALEHAHRVEIGFRLGLLQAGEARRQLLRPRVAVALSKGFEFSHGQSGGVLWGAVKPHKFQGDLCIQGAKNV